MKRKILSLLLIAVLLVSFVGPASAASASQFTDVNPSAWYYDAVDYVAKNGLFAGTTTTTFSPNASMTRGMFVTVLGRLAKADTNKYKQNRFKDVDTNRYYAPYVEWAATYGIVTGITTTPFAPDKDITREQIATILYRFASKTGNDTTYTSDAYNAFLDKGTVSNYAQNAVKWATSKHIIKGDSGNIKPKRTATRAEVAQMLMNAKDVIVKTEIISKPDPKPTEPIDETVYWVSGGSVYHSTKDCPSLSRSKNIQSGTVEEAKAAGKTEPCKVCHH